MTGPGARPKWRSRGDTGSYSTIWPFGRPPANWLVSAKLKRRAHRMVLGIVREVDTRTVVPDPAHGLARSADAKYSQSGRQSRDRTRRSRARNRGVPGRRGGGGAGQASDDVPHEGGGSTRAARLR